MKVDRDNPGISRYFSGPECGKLQQEVLKSGLLGSTTIERRVFLEALGVDDATNFQLDAAAPDLLFKLFNRLNAQWSLGQFEQNFRSYRDGLARNEMPLSEDTVRLRVAVAQEELEKMIAISRMLPTDERAKLLKLAINQLSKELGRDA